MSPICEHESCLLGEGRAEGAALGDAGEEEEEEEEAFFTT